MDIKEKAKEFAINAHKGQVRKSGKEKPMIIHPINVADILKEYNFDDNVISAGYLHDVIEDTKYTKEDLLKEFNEDIVSLVLGASEPDKSLSWEERKLHTINSIKKLDLRHKAIICADKISNLEDLKIFFEIKGEKDFSAFKRGYEKQKWYYTEVYKSLISNEDKNYSMFTRLKLLIDDVFENKKNDELERKIFKGNEEEYKKLIKLHYKKQEIHKMLKVLTNTKPYVIEFTGTPRTGKTTLINNLCDFFKMDGFDVIALKEFATSIQCSEEAYAEFENIIKNEILKNTLKELKEAISQNPDIILIDRSLFDRTIWMDRLYNKNGLSKQEYDEFMDKYIEIIKENIDIILATYTDSLTSLTRDYNANLSLETRTFLNEDNINEYNNSLINMSNISKDKDVNMFIFDTTEKNQRQISFEVADTILGDMRKVYVKKLNKKFNS